MAKEKLVWTVLPYGFDARGRLRVSIVMSPRLTPTDPTGQTLGGYPDFLDWPTTLTRLVFGLRVDGTDYKLELLNTPDSGVWSKLFTSDLAVAPFVFTDMSQHNLRSFPVRHLVRFLKDQYGGLAATQGLARPSLFPFNTSPLGPMIAAGASGIRWDGRDKQRHVPRGMDDLFSDGPIDQQVQEMYFSKYARQVPEQVRGIDGRPTANKKHSRIRALPADLPSELAAIFNDSVASYSLYQANRFYSRPEQSSPYRELPDPNATKDVIQTPVFDFHKLVASFADAPSLMRQLGLVLDAAVIGGDVLIAKAAATVGGLNGTMQLLLTRRGDVPAGVEDATPRTAWQLAPGRFVTQARPGGDHRDGLLALGGAAEVTRSGNGQDNPQTEPSPFNLVQVDPDGSAIKTVNFLNSMVRHLENATDPHAADTTNDNGALTYSTTDEESTPALRSGGITLIRHNRAVDLSQDLAANALKNDAFDSNAAQSTGVLLYAEDVLRGYRVDIHEQQSGKWRTLCARTVKYRAASDHQSLGDPVMDEGFVHGASTTTQSRPDDVDNNHGTQDHYLHEAVFKWTGWSLAVPRPGRRIVPRQEHGLIQEETVEAHTDADQAVGAGRVLTNLETRAGTLPRLRFGGTYRMRARVVDLAGNSLLADDPSLGALEQASDEITYQRLEPLDPPPLALARRVSEGESLERAVIRSDVAETAGGYQNVSAHDYLTQAPYGGNDPSVTGFAYGATNLRHVIPPKSSQTQAEQHGMFEQAFDAAGSAGGPQAIKDAYELITTRESGSLYDGGASVRLITPAQNGVSADEPLDPPPPEGFRLQPGQYVVHAEAHVATPYLPDPLAAAVVLRGVPGLTDTVVLDATDGVFATFIPFTKEMFLYVPLKGDWPNVDGFRILIAELPEQIDATPCSDNVKPADALPTWDRSTRTLTIFLRKGEIAPVRYACAVRPDHVGQLALPTWTGQPVAAFWSSLLAVLGSHWMMTPDRTLTLVHATQHPVCPPTFLRLYPSRVMGDTHADISRESFVRYHARSTGQLQVLAEWMEWIDDGVAGKPPLRRHVTARLKEVHIPQPGIDAAEPAQTDYAALGELVPDGKGGKLRPHIRHEFNDHKFRFVRYRLLATTRFREYLPASLTADEANVTRTGPVWVHDALGLPPNYTDDTIDGATSLECGVPLLPSNDAPQGQIVLASERPQPPRLAYIVPNQHWSDSTNGGLRSVERTGGCLRVYLERPWFSSGEGELLGVILSGVGDGAQTLADLEANTALEPYVSQWGQDPLYASTLPRPALTPAAFANAVYSENVFLPELGNEVVVAGHRVYFDAERNQWFADIQVDSGDSYMPMLRLSLVRYQPHALSKVKISVPVQAPFAQLLPRRRIDVQQNSDGYVFNVYGPVPAVGPASGAGLYPGLPLAWQNALGPGPGHNRIEVVVQTQDTPYDTDLEWYDAAEVPSASGEALPRQAVLHLTPHFIAAQVSPAAISGFSMPSVSRAIAPADLPQFSLSRLNPDWLKQIVALDCCVWTGRIAVPGNLRVRRIRLLLREYERHFSDNEVVVQPFGLHQPKVVERLVFAKEFEVTEKVD